MRTLTRAMAGLALVSMTAIADDAGRGAFENEIRILPAFLAELTHSTTGTGRQADTAIVAVHPGSGQVWMYYASLGIEILAQRGGIRTVSEAENLPQRWRTEAGRKGSGRAVPADQVPIYRDHANGDASAHRPRRVPAVDGVTGPAPHRVDRVPLRL